MERLKIKEKDMVYWEIFKKSFQFLKAFKLERGVKCVENMSA